jgi:hypothetical protein
MIKVLWEKHEEKAVSFETIRDSVERSRDRVRKAANMVLSSSGVLLTASFAFLVLLIERFPDASVGIVLRIGFCLSSACFLLAAVMSIVTSLLHARFSIATELKFVTDLLTLLQKEARLLRVAVVAFGAGLCAVFASIAIAASAL